MAASLDLAKAVLAESGLQAIGGATRLAPQCRRFRAREASLRAVHELRDVATTAEPLPMASPAAAILISGMLGIGSLADDARAVAP